MQLPATFLSRTCRLARPAPLSRRLPHPRDPPSGKPHARRREELKDVWAWRQEAWGKLDSN
eukprot:11091686-Alexandrium_andersonii.AAC.1